MLELKNVTKMVGAETHIAAVSLTLERGSLNVLLGPTLSGKTSLMRLMAGLDQPTSGTRPLVEGKDVTGVPVQKRNVAMVYQQFINYPALTVYENIASPLRVAGRPRRDRREVRKAAELAAARALSAADSHSTFPAASSSAPRSPAPGEEGRPRAARRAARQSRLQAARGIARGAAASIFAASGTIFVYATTEPSEALLLGGNTATLSEGRVTQFGPTVEVYRQPTDLVTAQTFSDPPLNTIVLAKKGGVFLLDGGVGLPVPAGLSPALPTAPTRLASSRII
jgi:glycerol transport system ATP-binding protein